MSTKRPRYEDEVMTRSKLVPLFEDLKDFIKSTAKGTETVLRDEFRKDIALVQHAITEHSKEIKGLGTDVAGIKTDVAEIRTDITEIRTDITEIRTDITEIRTDITEIRTDITEIRTDVADIKTEMKGMEIRLTDKIDRIGGKVENHEVRITKIEANQTARV